MARNHIGYLIGLTAAAMVIAACSSSGPKAVDHQSPVQPTTGAESSAIPTTTTDTSGGATDREPTGPANCRVDQLATTLGGGDGGAAGSTYLTVDFTNKSTNTCVLQGFPGVSYVNGPDGGPIGSAAQRDGDSFGPVTLHAGDSASAQLRAVNVGNYPDTTCMPTPAAGLRIYPPNDLDSVYIAHPTTACASTDADVHQLGIEAVERH